MFFEEGIDENERKGLISNREYISFNREKLDGAFLKAILMLRDFYRIVLFHRGVLKEIRK